MYREGGRTPLTVEWAQEDGPGVLVRFREVRTREAADRLRDVYLEARAPAEREADSFYWHEIVGIECRTTDGEVLGTVDDVFRAGGGEVYAVRGGPRGEVLVPAVRAVVTELVPAERRMTVDADALGLEELRPRRPRGRRSSRAAREREAVPSEDARGDAVDPTPGPDALPAEASGSAPGPDAPPATSSPARGPDSPPAGTAEAAPPAPATARAARSRRASRPPDT